MTEQMTLAKTVPLAIALAAALAAFHSPITIIQAAFGENVTAASEADMTFFYKDPSPDRVARLLVYFDTLTRPDKPNVPPIVGFMAVAFQRYPSDIDKMIPEGLSATMQGNIATSLKLAGQDSKAQSLADHLKTSGAPAPDLRYVPSSLDAVAASGPSEFDLFWGASFASGDPRYASKILEHFAAVANADGNAEDMVTVARTFGNGADMSWLVKKRGAQKAGELIAQSTALWALNSNAQQHEFVRNAVEKYIAAHPEESASKALIALAQEYGHYDIKRVASLTETAAGKHSVTVNLVYLNRVLDDLGRHAGTYPVHFQFPDDRQRAERDVSAISGLLDPLSQDFSHNAPLQLRLGLLHAIGFNLDIPGSHEKAVAAFSTMMELTPNDPQANYQYGAFLAATTRKGEGIPFLEKAKSLGAVNADYWLGWSYEALGEKSKAVENFESYIKRVPTDQNAARILDAVRNDKVKVEERKTIP
jgi:tetratricopeptide (TPR) repeat protein